MHRMVTAARAAFTLLVVIALLCGQTTSLTEEHSPQHCCGLCHVGPMPFLQATISATETPVRTVAWIRGATDLEVLHGAIPAAGDSRAPPA